MRTATADRASRSLLYPGMEIPAGAAYCLACPWAVFDDPECGPKAHDHFLAEHHPTAARAPGAANNPG